MLEIKRKRSHAIIMWLLSAAVTMGSLCWRLFLPVYYQNNPNVWHIWLKGAVAIFLFPLILAPAGIYRWLPRLLQHWKANKPWLLCVIIFIEVLLTYLFFGHILYLAKSLAVAVVMTTILMVPRMDEKSREKPFSWILPSTVLLFVCAGLSYCLPWRGNGQSDYNLAVALGMIVTSWLFTNTIKTKDIGKGRPFILALLPFALSYFLVALQHVVFAANSGTIQMTLERWKERINIYSAIRIGDPVGATWMHIIIPTVNILLGIVLARFGNELGKDSRRNALFLLFTYVLMVLAGTFCFYSVLPDVETPIIMPHHSCITALPISIFCASNIGDAFQKENWLRLNSTP